MSTPETRARQRVEELSAAAIRAVSGSPDAHFRGGRLHRGIRPVPMPAPHLRADDEDVQSFRGAADGMALHLSRSDRDLHRRLRPEGGVERLLFELLEQFRVESLVPAGFPGVTANLRRRHERWSLSAHHNGLTESARGVLIYTVAQVARARITGEPVVAETEDLIEATRAAIAPMLGAQLAGLRRSRADQAAFAEHARALAETVAGLLEPEKSEKSEDEDEEDAAAYALLLDFDDETGSEEGGTARLGDHQGPVAAGSYRVFTTAYDREDRAGPLVRPELLRELRDQLDARVAKQGVNVARLARELTAVLAEPERSGWDGAQEEGQIDGRALARLIATPADHRVFRVERTEPVADVLVTFLIDCSGSMKAHRETVAVLVDLFARALDLAGARCEILGFTTGAWHGGRARRDWLRAGRPKQPGRLNERRHLVFKDAATPWRRARRDVAALLKADLFREGIDGEALAWAAERAQAWEARRRLVFVLSDGSPMDGATALANEERYLDRHLVRVADGLERGETEVYGIGVGLDLSAYYRRSLALDAAEGTGFRAFREILDLLARR
ncbi:cobaltochelatase CobT-related protein [Amycolatopsis echigonensis]|uniref:Cobaltochelatase CobT n=1 Tax=Amycolatopsis echigonensis TaxID=2576905 RepID=A0A2N3WT12_9PSEU|nr:MULTISPECIES: cobalt chelatase [Amycolatopsis]PKV96985.1 cobaltochelatase CobT [Amycolatopsis niigatensis]